MNIIQRKNRKIQNLRKYAKPYFESKESLLFCFPLWLHGDRSLNQNSGMEKRINKSVLGRSQCEKELVGSPTFLEN